MPALHSDPDPLLSFREAGRYLRPERPIHASAFFRWMRGGVRGRVLSTTLVGGRRYVRLSQLQAFIADLSGEPDHHELTSPAPLKRCREIAAAEAELDAAGIN